MVIFFKGIVIVKVEQGYIYGWNKQYVSNLLHYNPGRDEGKQIKQ